MPKSTKAVTKNATSSRMLTKADERRILDAQSARIRKDPALGTKIAQDAGILTKNGNLTTFYRSK